jgi:hypothetical protein
VLVTRLAVALKAIRAEGKSNVSEMILLKKEKYYQEEVKLNKTQ